jgi:DNA polymerase III alpha subunit (gram-positive type)
MELLTLIEIRRRSIQQGAVEARVHVQVEAVTARVTREQKPYCELGLADAADRMTLRVWSDHPEFKTCDSLQVSDFIELSGEFQQHQQYGLEAKKWSVRNLTAQERSELLQGPPNCGRNNRRTGTLLVNDVARSRTHGCELFVRCF